MGIVERLRAAMRAFVVGPSIVRMHETVWGHDSTPYAPTELGDYITSNAVYACSTLRTRLLGSLSPRLYRTVPGQAQRTEVVKGPLYDLLQRVNPHWTFRRLLEMTEMSLCVWGQAFWFLERGESGLATPQEIWWARPDRVRVVPHPRDYLSGFLLEPVEGGLPVAYQPQEVIWLRYVNPMDEFSPLSPLQAARLAADYAGAAMQSNLGLFRNGYQAGGLVAPRNGMTFTNEQADTLMEALDRRFKGADKAHRWGVMRADVEVTPLGMTPQDAEFIQGLNWSLEDVARAYQVPLDLIGGQRTYENVRAAMRAIWTNCLLPEADFVSDELTEQLLRLFPGQGDLVELDTTKVEALQEDETERWARARSQIEIGALTVNEWRRSIGLEPVAWGDVWWAGQALMPVESSVVAVSSTGDSEAPVMDGDGTTDERRGTQIRPTGRRAVEFGGEDHRRVWGRFVRRSGRYEEWLTAAVQPVLESQRDSVIDKLKATRQRGITDGHGSTQMGVRAVDPEWFDMAAWVKRMRETVRPVLGRVVEDVAAETFDELGVSTAFQVNNPLVARFLKNRAQRFAERVNDTTWEMLKASLNEGMAAGENIPELTERVLVVMEDRIRSTPEAIARTEATGAANGGTLEAWRQSGVVRGKEWIAALDDRTRDSHIEAHGQVVGLDEDFEVGGVKGAGPGMMGSADEDINCRCTVGAVLG